MDRKELENLMFQNMDKYRLDDLAMASNSTEMIEGALNIMSDEDIKIFLENHDILEEEK